MDNVPAARLPFSLANEEHRKVAKFIVVGVLKTAFAYGLFVLLVWMGVHYNLALAGDYVVGITLGYVLNRYWTFSDQGRPKAGLLKYLVAYGLVFLLNLVILMLVVELVVPIFFVEAGNWGPTLGQIPALVIATAAAYLLQRYWVFKGA